MLDMEVIWDLADDPGGNVQHMAEHDVTIDEVEEVLGNPRSSTVVDKKRIGRFITGGETADGRYLEVVWETALEDPLTVYPITAFDSSRRRHKRR
jgi:hypothetical protein